MNHVRVVTKAETANPGRPGVSRLVGTAIALLATTLLLGPAFSQGNPGPAGTTTQPDEVATTQPQEDPEAERQKLLAEMEKEQGPTSPGKDPAFLVLPRPGERGNMARELLGLKLEHPFGIPDPTEESIKRLTPVQMADRALEYLARTQDNDGGWSDTKFPSNTGVTALCCLAFMAEGSRPRAGKYGKQLDDGLDFLLRNVQSNGTIAGKGSNPYGPGYEHALSTLALLYAYGDMPWRPQTRDVIARAIQVTARSQKLDGGWRYQMSREALSDMSVTANVLWVMRTAKKAGFTVPADKIAEGVRYVEGCAMPDGRFRYRTHGLHATPSMGGVGIIALANNGNIDHILIPPARDAIAKEYKRYTVDDFKVRRYAIYGIFYASIAMYMCQDEYWIPWFRKAAQILAAMQRKDGEFADMERTSKDFTVWTTAMATMVLLAPRGYLPIYER